MGIFIPMSIRQPEPITDFALCALVHRMWSRGGNLEARSISLCFASKLNQQWSEEFHAETFRRLKALVRSGELRRQRFLKGRPFYTIS